MPKKFVTFVIDGESVDVSECTWDIIEDTIMPILEAAVARRQAGMEVSWWRSRADDVRILAAAMRKPYEEVRTKLSFDEARMASEGIGELLKISGFVAPGEDQATTGSTEISTDSSQA